MSWSLLNQNLETSLLRTAPNPEEEIIPELLYEHPTNYYNAPAGEQYRGMFAVNPDGSEIMIIPRGAIDVWFSDDDGETWSEMADYRVTGSPQAFPVSAIRYHAGEDTWWIGERDDSAANIKFLYSENDGAAWSITPTTVIEEDYCLSFNVHPDGTLYYHNRSVTTIQFARLADPKSTHVGTQFVQTSVHNNSNKWASGILEDQYFVGLWGTAMVISNSLNPAGGFTYYPAGITTQSIRCAFGPDYGLVWSSESAGLVTLARIYFGVTAPLPTITFNFGFDVQYSNIWYGNERFVLTARDMSDSSILYVVLMNPDTFVWGSIYTITLPRIFDPSATLGSELRHQLEYYKDGYWLFSYLKDVDASSSARFVLIKFFLDDASPFPSAGDTKLFMAIDRQSPDIFFRLDDALGSDSVLDVGRRNYTNTAHGSLTFGQTGLIGDGGDACLIDSATNTGVLVEAVPAPTNHAHFFVLTHDGTASVRVLACSGDFDNTSGVGYYVFLAANHKLGVAVYDGGWQYVYSTTALTLNTIYRCAVSVASDGKVTFYIGTAWDAASEDVPYTTLTATTLSLGGGWTGGSALSSSANGVTVDYYALIPLETFDYQLIVEAEGGTYTPPTPVTSEELTGVQFLVHANETTLTAVNLSGVQAYQFVNSVPGSLNRIVSELTNSATVADSKFGARAMEVRASDRFLWSTPPEAPYWVEGGNLELGRQDFTYDLWAKTQGSNNITVLGSSHGAHARGTYYDEYGGISFITSRDTATTVDVYIKIGCSLSSALNGRRAGIEMHFNGAGYVDAGYNHFAVCRHNGLWAVYVNGRKATVVGVVRRDGQHEDTVFIHRGGKWWIGGTYRTTNRSEPQTAGRLTTYQSRYDEIRLIVGRAEFTENFIAPAAPYDYD